MGTHLVSFLVLLILSRLLTPAEIGLVALATVFISAGQVVLDLGLSQALIQRRDNSALDVDTAFWITLASGVLLASGFSATSDVAAAVFGEAALGPVLRWSSISLLLLSMNATQKALLQRELAFGRLAARTLAAELVGGAVGIGMAMGGYGVWSLVARNLIRDLTGVIVLWKVSPWRPRPRASGSSVREMRSFGTAVIGARALEFLHHSADQVLIGYFAGPAMLGYYVVGLRVLRVVRQLLVESIAAVAFPFFSRLQDDPKRLRRSYLAGTRFTTLAAFPAFLGLALVAPELIAVLLGEAWVASVPVMQVMALLGLVQAAGFFPGAVLLAMGRPVWRLGLNLVNSIGNVVAILLAVPSGLTAVAVAQVVRAYLLFPLSLHAARVTLGLRWRDYLMASIPAASGSVAMVAAVAGIRGILAGQGQEWVRLGAAIAVGAAVYILTIRMVSPQSLREAIALVRSVFHAGGPDPGETVAD